MNTGDIVLYRAKESFTPYWFLDKIIEIFTGSHWVHVGFVLVDPPWIPEGGTYLWESGWTGLPDAVSHKKKFGVQIVPLSDRIVPECTFVRKYIGTGMDHDKLFEVYLKVKNKTYDMCLLDWVEAAIQKDPNPQKKNRFFCSALVGCILTGVGILPPKTDWSIITPSFFSYFNKRDYGPITEFKN